MWWTPDLSQRSETAGRWPRLATGENTTPIWQLDGHYAQDAPPSVPRPLWATVDYYAGPHLEEHRGGKGHKRTANLWVSTEICGARLWPHLGTH